MSNGRPQRRQHPEACACTFGMFYTDIRRMNETTNETAQPCRPKPNVRAVWCIAWSEVAEDRRFELLRGCPQHAFQQCWLPFIGVRHRPRTARTRSERTLVHGDGRG